MRETHQELLVVAKIIKVISIIGISIGLLIMMIPDATKSIWIQTIGTSVSAYLFSLILGALGTIVEYIENK